MRLRRCQSTSRFKQMSQQSWSVCFDGYGLSPCDSPSNHLGLGDIPLLRQFPDPLGRSLVQSKSTPMDHDCHTIIHTSTIGIRQTSN